MAISLGYLDRTIEALRKCIVDDVHVASRFADLLDTLTKRIRPRFIRFAGNGSGNQTTNGAAGSDARNGGHATARPGRSVQTSPLVPNSPNWTYNNIMQQATFATYSNTPPDPLSGVSTQAYNINDAENTFSAMPPPTTNPTTPNLANAQLGANGSPGAYNHFQQGNNSADNAFMYNNDHVSDWLSLDLDPIFHSNGELNQTGYGPAVGNYDMLELLLNS